jgi:hypothetical protein
MYNIFFFIDEGVINPPCKWKNTVLIKSGIFN